MIGSVLRLNTVSYTLTERLGAGACAQVFKAQASDGQQRLIKKYPKGRAARPYTRGRRNHYGTMRDVSKVVFDELRKLAERCPFVPKLIERQRIDGSWFLVMEFVRGQNFAELLQESLTVPGRAEAASELLGRVVRQWHNAGIAHGDPHLYNALVELEGVAPSSVRLIDMNMVHHPSFKYCQRCGCSFDRTQERNRYDEDLRNNDRRVGAGFLNELEREAPIRAQTMIEAFLLGYGQ